MLRFLVVLGLVAVTTVRSSAAQDERHLKQQLEGKRVTVLIDMPASQEGIDVVPGSSRPLDFQKYSGRLKKYGTAIREGDKALITKIRVKDDLIEVQLGGGGYGTFGDFLSSAVTNNGADSGAAQQLKISNERTQRLAGGSRFNLRFPNGVTPDDLEPAAIVKALVEYATFPASLATKAAPKEPAPEPEPVVVARQPAAPTGQSGLHKGMSEQDLEVLAGKALSTSSSGPVTTKKYRWQDGVLEADLVNGIVVAYRITSG